MYLVIERYGDAFYVSFEKNRHHRDANRNSRKPDGLIKIKNVKKILDQECNLHASFPDRHYAAIRVKPGQFKNI